MIRLLAVFTGGVVLAAPLWAQTTNVLAFDAYTRAGTEFTAVAKFPEEKGFIFSSTPNNTWGYATWNTGSPNYRGSAALFNNNCCSAILSQTNGAPFNFLGFDYAGLQTFTTGGVSLTGYRALTPVVRQTFLVSSGGNFQTFTTAAFTNITELRWQGAGIQFDNVRLVSTTNAAARPRLHDLQINSIVYCGVSGLKVGKTYAFEASTNLVDWDVLRTREAISTIDQQSDARYYNRPRFHRLREVE